MLEGSSDYGHTSKMFDGLRFVLLGFDPISAHKVRSKLVNGGGIDVAQYNPNCTHLIVDKLVYDDPICVAARSDGKTLVTGLWVDHSFDIGMPVDPTSIMYQPRRDLNGIPGAQSLIICLTGYQKQDRDDIMTMVCIMGANFSKPLVANKVTHLICYKFEGEKFELAKKMKKIKLVNHRWLEDCLRAWEILPEANYDKSGYELEMMEAEAKDSEEEPEAESIHKKQDEERKINASPHNLQIGTVIGHQSPTLKEEVSRKLLETSTSIALSDVNNTTDIVSPSGKETISNHLPTLRGPLKPYDSTPMSAGLGNDLASTSGSTKRSPLSDATKLSSVSYTRKTPKRTSLPSRSGEMATTDCSFPHVSTEKLDASNGFAMANSKLEQAKYDFDSEVVRSPSVRTEIRHKEGLSDKLPEKRKMDVSCRSSKLQKTSRSPKACTSEYSLPSRRTEGLEPVSLVNGPVEINTHLTHDGHNTNFTPGPAQKSPVSAKKSLNYGRKPLPCDSPPKSAISEIKQDNNAEEGPQRSCNVFKKTGLANKSVIDVMSRPQLAFSMVGEPQNKLQDVDLSSSMTKKFENEKPESPANLDLPKGEKADSLSKPLRKKTIAKKSLGTRPKLGTGTTASKKGSIYSHISPSQNHTETCLIREKGKSDDDKPVNSEKCRTLPTVDSVVLANNILNKTLSIDDETEAPEDEENEFEAVMREEKPREVEPAPMADIVVEKKSEGAQMISDETHDREMASGGVENGNELERTVFDEINQLGESTCMENPMEDNIAEKRRYRSSKTTKKTVCPATGTRKSNEIVDGEEAESEKNKKKKTGKEKEKGNSSPEGKAKRSLPVNELENSMQTEKENMPVVIRDKNVSHSKQVGKVASKSKKMPTKRKASETDGASIQVERVPEVKIEPVWFILSGHRLQRKEFQQVIRRLKGRVCRDSHQWSYQATHLIVPDPLRRTEKFFAAAASGRWILKTDYLTANNQAGRFLAEEPYEWHKNGLSEDGAINLEAPRKWRLLRERTGHGAFYGMRIIIYGECIAPPLDTLKRVVKAGDGTILATSPPYTRFLESGVDFAIVSPGMPRVDIWVQEFLRHEIPCVVADYLVEYVCKPGYALERHVQYSTRAWAERSFANLQSRSEEIVEGQTSPENHVNNDLPCQVCRSRDRGEVMLICGDESGTTGCGVGTHIDCCDPPLEEVPEDDWFCPKCCKSTKNMNQESSTKKRTPKKGTSLKKRE